MSPEPTPVLLGRLANGAVFAFQLSPTATTGAAGGGGDTVFAGLRTWVGAAAQPAQLPPPAAAAGAATVASGEGEFLALCDGERAEGPS